jgi:apolipoprotein N-acyltransferase
MVLFIAHVWGAAVLSSSANQASAMRVAVIQPNIQIAERQTEEGRRTNLDRLEQLTRKALPNRPALIVWPESAIPGELRSDPALVSRLQSLADQIQVPLIVGAAQVEKFARGEAEVTISPRVFNTAHLLRPGERLVEPYRKRVLVPFAEYMPHSDVLHWPEWLVPRVSEMTPGEGVQLFKVTPDLTVGALICWENLFASLARQSVHDGAQVLVQLTNDVWFGHSAAPYQHNLMSVMRAVENRVPVLVASNTGPSQIIDGHGRVVAGVPETFVDGVTTGHISIGAANTVYTLAGDAVVVAWLLVITLTIIVRIRSVGRQTAVQPTSPATSRQLEKVSI